MASESREGQKKVAICGFASTWNQAPFDDPTVEIWGLNELWKYLPRWNRWFEVHDENTLGLTTRDLSEGEQKRHLDWLVQQPAGKPIYMQPKFCDGRFPAAVPFPLEPMIAEFGRYFTSTIGYMLAMAISEGYDWIGLYGVDLASDVEYPAQRPNTEYLIGLAKGMGKTVVIPPQSSLLKAGFLYGYEQPPTANPFLVAVTSHRDTLNKKRDECIATLNTLDGAITECENAVKWHEYTLRGCDVKTY